MSFIFPIRVEHAVGSNTLLGLIMASSSIAGIACDLLFPQLLRNTTWKKQLLCGAILSLLFPILTIYGVWTSSVLVFLIAGVIWGVYYELISFSEQNFVTTDESKGDFTKAWGILFATSQFTGILGPILGSLLLTGSNNTLLVVILFLQLLSILFSALISLHLKSNYEYKPRTSHLINTINVFREIRYWKIFTPHILPAIIVGVWLEAIEATFWTIGGLFGKQIVEESNLDWTFVVLYSAPFIVGSLILAKLNISSGKKRLSHLTMILAGIILTPIYLFASNWIPVAALIFLASFFLSFAGPLNESVYSDLIRRSGNYKDDLLGLSKANSSLAYIVIPVVVGILADNFSYSMVFSTMGIFTVLIGLLLLTLTPKKLHISISDLDRSSLIS